MRTWLRAASLGAVAVGLCAHWWFLSWLTRRRLNQTGWRSTRIAWPTGAVAAAWLAAIAGFLSGSEAVGGTLAAAAVIVNLPLIPVLGLAGLLSELLPGWVLVPAATAAAWFWWWAIILFFERRARDTGPVTLGI